MIFQKASCEVNFVYRKIYREKFVHKTEVSNCRKLFQLWLIFEVFSIGFISFTCILDTYICMDQNVGHFLQIINWLYDLLLLKKLYEDVRKYNLFFYFIHYYFSINGTSSCNTLLILTLSSQRCNLILEQSVFHFPPNFLQITR